MLHILAGAKPGFSILYDAATQAVAIADQRPEEVRRTLAGGGERHAMDESVLPWATLPASKADRGANSAGVRTLYLGMTTGCNLNCAYCLQRGLVAPSVMMREDVIAAAMAGLGVLAKQKPRIGIVLYGGEPLLHKRGIVSVVMRLEKLIGSAHLPPETSLTLLTNGTLLDADVIALLKRVNGSVSISVDGPYDPEDQRCGGQPRQFERILRGVDLLHRAGLPLVVSCTPQRSRKAPLAQRVAWIVNTLAPRKIGINPLQYTSADEYSEAAHDDLTEEILAAYEYLLGVGVPETYLGRVMAAFDAGTVVERWCGSHQEHVVVGTSGEIKKCVRFVRADEGNTGIHVTCPDWVGKLERWKAAGRWPVFPRASEECGRCVAYGICGGGHRCNAIALSMTGEPEARDGSHCRFARRLIVWMLGRIEREWHGARGG